MFLNDTVRYVLIGVITSAWVFNIFAPILPFSFLKGYNPDPSINAVFMIVIGALFGADALGRVRGNGNRGQQGRGRGPQEDNQIESSEDGGS